MIKLDRGSEPEHLTNNKTQWLRELTGAIEKYGGFSKIPSGERDNLIRHYKDKRIKSPLCKSSHEKCAFCESKPGEAGYPEIDHFKPKAVYPLNVFDCMRRVHTPPLWGVKKGMYPETNTLPKQPYPVRSAAGLVDWDNLVPVCKKCNVQKSAHDTVKAPIIDPYKDDPECAFEYDGFEIKARTGAMNSIAQKTIDVCKLNEGRLLDQRADILLALRALEQNLENAISNNISVRNLRKSLSIINAFEEPEQKLAGFCRAFLKNSKSYQSAKTIAAGGAGC